MGALPEGEKEQSQSNYMSFEQGENTFRILSPIITGLEYWKTVKGEDGKDIRQPFRLRTGEKVPISELETNPKTGDLEMPKYFWAMVVYNRNAEKVQILQITQSTIRTILRNYEKNKKWGDLRNYDITVTREGEGYDTKYTVMADPDKGKVDPGIKRLYEDMEINLEALYEGKDPFAKQEVDENDIPEDL